MKSFDAIVAGLGITGAAVTRELARRGIHVLGIDALEPPHDRGSSHGPSRIIRQAYYEDPLYVPMVRRAFDLWSGLEAEAGRPLLSPAPALMVGPAGGAIVRGTLDSVRSHGLPHEVLETAALHDRFPDLRPGDDMTGVLETHAGILAAETAHTCVLESGRRHGAAMAFNERMTAFASTDGGVRVATSQAEYSASRLVLACGSWLPGVLGRTRFCHDAFTVERQVVAHFASRDGRPFDAERLPILLVDDSGGDLLYSLPDTGAGLKAGLHHGGAITNPGHVDRTVGDDDIARIRDLLSRYLPAACGEVRDSTVCLYTNTPDGHFVLDYLPGEPRIVLASACSGHGFKFAPVTGEIVADLVLERAPAFDTSVFGAARLRVGPMGSPRRRNRPEA